MAPTGTRQPGDPGAPGAEPTLVPPGRPSLGAGRVEAADLGEQLLEAGGPRLPVTLAYRHDGPGPDAPQVLVVHALTGSADAAGDWWAPLIGPGAAIGSRWSTASGRASATSWAIIPPSDPPVTSTNRSMSSRSASAHRARASSRAVGWGKVVP